MASRLISWLQRRRRQRVRDYWVAAGDLAGTLTPGGLRDLRDDARGTRREIDRFLRSSDMMARRSRAALDAVLLPPGTDWRWRPWPFSAPLSPAGVAGPGNGHRLGDDTAVWHDCPGKALVLRQIENLRTTDLAPFGLRMEVFGFGGSFLSLSADLPPDVLHGLTGSHIIRVETLILPEREMNIYVRLNIGHGPNTTEEVRHLGGMQPRKMNHHVTEFDLAYSDITYSRLQKAWVDLIFEAPQMNAVDLRDIYISRHLRAEL